MCCDKGGTIAIGYRGILIRHVLTMRQLLLTLESNNLHQETQNSRNKMAPNTDQKGKEMQVYIYSYQPEL